MWTNYLSLSFFKKRLVSIQRRHVIFFKKNPVATSNAISARTKPPPPTLLGILFVSKIVSFEPDLEDTFLSTWAKQLFLKFSHLVNELMNELQAEYCILSDSLRTTIRQKKKPLTLTSQTSIIKEAVVCEAEVSHSSVMVSWEAPTDKIYGCRCLAGIRSTLFTTLFGRCPLFSAMHFSEKPQPSKKRCAQCPSDWAEYKELGHLRLGQWTTFNSNGRSWSLSIVLGILPITVNQSVNQSINQSIEFVLTNCQTLYFCISIHAF